MASIHKRFKSPFWVAAFTGVDSRRKQKSTKTRDRSRAMKIALDWAKAAKAGRAGRLTEAQCRRVLSEIHEEANGEPLHFDAAGEFLNEWLASKKSRTSPRTFDKYSQYVREFAAHLKERANSALDAVRKKDVETFLDSLLRAGHSPTTVNGALKILRMPFRNAHQLGRLTINPTAGVQPLKDHADIERDVFTPEQIGALVTAVEALRQEAQANNDREKENAFRDWKGAILCGYYTGLRLGDVTQLKWENVDLGTGLLRVKTIKTGAVVTIPIHVQFAAWLRKQTRGIGKAPLFPSLIGKSSGGERSGLSTAFNKIMERAGIKGRILRRRKKGSAGRTTTSLGFHALRHSFNSALANQGVSQEIRQRLTGHSDQATNKRYTHHEITVLRAAVDALPRVTQ
jgi:integrase